MSKTPEQIRSESEKLRKKEVQDFVDLSDSEKEEIRDMELSSRVKFVQAKQRRNREQNQISLNIRDKGILGVMRQRFARGKKR